MKLKKLWGGVAILVLTLNGWAADQRFGPMVSAMMSAGEESGSAFGAGVKYESLLTPTVGLDVRGGFIHDGDIGLIPLMFGPVFLIPLDALTVSVGAGGLYGIPTGSDADNALGFYALVGLRGPTSDDSIEWFAEVQYSDVEGDSASSTTITPGRITRTSSEKLDFEAIGVNVGILLKF